MGTYKSVPLILDVQWTSTEPKESLSRNIEAWYSHENNCDGVFFSKVAGTDLQPMASVAYFDSSDVRGYYITNISITNNDYISNTQKQPLEVFYQKGVLKKFTKFTRKHLCLRPTALLKMRLWHRCFPATLLQNTSKRLLLNTKILCSFRISLQEVFSKKGAFLWVLRIF